MDQPSKGELSKFQLAILNDWLAIDSIIPEERHFIAETTGLTEYQVDSWLHRQRCLRTSQRSSNCDQMTVENTWILDKAYKENKYAVKKTIGKLSEKTGLSEMHVSRWFRNRRMREDQTAPDMIEEEPESDVASTEIRSEKEAGEVRESKDESQEFQEPFGPQIDSEKAHADHINQDTLEEELESDIVLELSGVKESEEFENEARLAANQSQERPTSQIDSSPIPVNEIKVELMDSKPSTSSVSQEMYQLSQISEEKPEVKFCLTRKFQDLQNLAEDQLSVLNEWFATLQYINEEERNYIAEITGLTKFQVSHWFRTQRRKNAKGDSANLLKKATNFNPQKPVPKMTPKFTDDQKKILQEAFKEGRYPKKNKIQEISKQTGLKFFGVVQWFNRQRSHSCRYFG
ncbi:hypothetical protein L596_028878 [Steinernema carpocapsae]|uniref:Homeobox domain-containing protein n=1 Tax=Steinernema carpocapsae TaxID=34508 RepID=A0A4U5M0Q6_STECR|nr:hypothetical protein L596_028878 [Steinernema carpocapsae]